MRRSVPALLITGTTTTMVLSACGPSQSAAPIQVTPAAPTAGAASTGSASITAGVNIQGPSEDMQWGPVQVTLVVQGKRISDVQATAPTERARSAYINNIAVPMLRQEVLQAQSANIDGISGATMTSEAFYLSLLAALKQAHL